jgi:hypothetical protein
MVAMFFTELAGPTTRTHGRPPDAMVMTPKMVVMAMSSDAENLEALAGHKLGRTLAGRRVTPRREHRVAGHAGRGCLPGHPPHALGESPTWAANGGTLWPRVECGRSTTGTYWSRH